MRRCDDCGWMIPEGKPYARIRIEYWDGESMSSCDKLFCGRCASRWRR